MILLKSVKNLKVNDIDKKTNKQGIEKHFLVCYFKEYENGFLRRYNINVFYDQNVFKDIKENDVIPSALLEVKDFQIDNKLFRVYNLKEISKN